MHIDARELENNSIIEGDLCIIGAGAAGISIALEWVNTPYKVILLEGGGFEYDNDIQNFYKGKTTGQKYFPLKATHLHYFGGTTGHWAGYCALFDEIDFQKRDWVENSGWPITKKDLDTFYDRAIKKLELHSKNFSLKYWQKKDSSLIKFPINNDVVWNKMWQFSPPTRFGSKYKDEIVNAKNIHLYTYANVTNISAYKNLSNIEEVTIKNLSKKKHKVKAKYFILASGGIQNPRLLLASNKQISNGIGNENDIVGRYFMEHLEIKSAELWLTKSFPMDLYLFNYGETKARAELAIKASKQKEHKILNGTVSLFPLDEARSLKPRLDISNNEDPRKNKLSTLEKIKKRLLTYKESTKKNIDRAYELFTRIEQAPNPTSRITLGNKKDALGVPRANLHWVLTSLEKRSIRKMYELIGRQTGIAEIGRVKLMDYLLEKNDASWPKFTGAGMHHMGTTRMHNDPKKGVVDSNCKVHNIDNLFIAGSSCFTTAGAANPTLTLVALSLRLSDYLKEKIKHS